MSESEYDSDYDSEYDSDTSDDSEVTEATYTSLEAALADMTARMAELDHALNTTETVAHTLEHPVTAVAVSAFTNPRVLESAPFRTTKFRLKHAAKVALGAPHHTVTFAELCTAIRQAKKEDLEALWSSSLAKSKAGLTTSEFLGVLQRLPEIVE